MNHTIKVDDWELMLLTQAVETYSKVNGGGKNRLINKLDLAWGCEHKECKKQAVVRDYVTTTKSFRLCKTHMSSGAIVRQRMLEVS